jgi:hypothetical protein
MSIKAEQKAGIIEAIIHKAFAIFSGDPFKALVATFVTRNYVKGIRRSNPNAQPNYGRLKLLIEQAQSEVDGVLSDLNFQLKQTVREAVINNENPTQIRQRIKLLLNPTDARIYEFTNGRKIRWSDRLELITRTEANRANNMGHLDSFSQSGFKGKKYLSIHPDERLCPICAAAGVKYDKENPIPLEDQFEVSISEGTFKFLAPPVHPNCRCRVMFAIDKDAS